MEKISIGILTVSDSCFKKEAVDKSGPNLVCLIENNFIKNGVVITTDLVPDDVTEIKKVLKNWCDEEKLNVILTTGGTGLGPRDVTPEATAELLEKTTSGISQLIFKCNSEITPYAALSRCLSGIRGKSLIINLPGSKKAAQESLEAVKSIIPHAVDLICNNNSQKIKSFHFNLQCDYISKVKPNNPEQKNVYPCIKVSDAQNLLFEKLFILKKEIQVPLNKALGCVLAQEVAASDSIPIVDVSLKDGYAVLSTDNTRERKIVGTCIMGSLNSNINIVSGVCAKISTGAALPPGADAVIPIENVTSTLTPDVVDIRNSYEIISKSKEVRAKGSDIKKGSLLLKYGTYLNSPALGVLASAGVTDIKIFAKPKVAVFSIGDELIDPKDELTEAKVRDCNRIILISLLQEEGFLASDLGIVRDDPNSLFSSLVKAFKSADVVVTSGSMSMGDKDYMKKVIETDFDSEFCFKKVFMMPGKPTASAFLNFEGKTKLWFGMPGNPASAFVTSQLFLIPALKIICGQENVLPLSVVATLKFDIFLTDRPQYHRAILSINEQGKYVADTTGNQRSSRIGSCLNANCLLEIPDGKNMICKGSQVRALLIGKLVY